VLDVSTAMVKIAATNNLSTTGEWLMTDSQDSLDANLTILVQRFRWPVERDGVGTSISAKPHQFAATLAKMDAHLRSVISVMTWKAETAKSPRRRLVRSVRRPQAHRPRVRARRPRTAPRTVDGAQSSADSSDDDGSSDDHRRVVRCGPSHRQQSVGMPCSQASTSPASHETHPPLVGVGRFLLARGRWRCRGPPAPTRRMGAVT
jgi:hypothetical protein